MRRRNRDNLPKLVEAVLKSKKTGRLVEVSLWKSDKVGHSVVAYDLRDTDNPREQRLYVYDCNYPGDDNHYITLTRNRSDKYAGWSYEIAPDEVWSAGDSGSKIEFTTYDDIMALWNSREGTHQSNTNILTTSTQDFEVLDRDSKVVARVEDGTLTYTADGDVAQFVPTDLGSGSDNASVMLYLPSGEQYSVRGTDGSEQLNVGMGNSQQSAIVTGEGSEVTFDVDDAREKNMVDVVADEGQAYTITLNSDLECAKGSEKIVLGGEGNIGGVGTVTGKWVMNGRVTSLTVNGTPKDVGGATSRKVIAPGDVTLAFDSCTYDGDAQEPSVSVTHQGVELELGRDYVVNYARNVKPGTATATVYCLADGSYLGTVSKTFEILPLAQTVSASNKTVQTGKTVALGARASAGGKLTYKSSNTSVATVSAKGAVSGKKAGRVTITITAEATETHAAATKTVTVTVKGPNTLACKAKAKSFSVKAAKVTKKAQTLKGCVKVTKGGQGRLTYANASKGAPKKFKVNAKTGAVTVPKGTKKGTYKLKVKVTAAGDATHSAATRTVSLKVVVR